MFKAKVIIKRRKSILDPQGKAAEQGAKLLGFLNIDQVRINKEVEFFVNLSSKRRGFKRGYRIKETFANPIMEDFEWSWKKQMNPKFGVVVFPGSTAIMMLIMP